MFIATGPSAFLRLPLLYPLLCLPTFSSYSTSTLTLVPSISNLSVTTWPLQLTHTLSFMHLHSWHKERNVPIYSEEVGQGWPLAIRSLIKQSISVIVKIFRRSLGYFWTQHQWFSRRALTSKALKKVLLIGMLIRHYLINILINKTCSRALEVEGLPTKSMVLSSKITKRTSENLHHSRYRFV